MANAPVITARISVEKKQVTLAMRTLANAAQDVSTPLRLAVLPGVRRIMRERFRSQGGYGGKAYWRQNTAVTLELRRKRGYFGRKPLIASGRLMRAFTQDTGDTQVRVTPSSLSIDVTVPYADAAQGGWTQYSIFGRPRKQPRFIPVRRAAPTQWPEKPVAEWERAILNWIMRS